VDSPIVNKWYGTYPIGDHGVFVSNRAKAKTLIARKLSQERKPSAYKRKVKVDNSDDSSNKRAKETRDEGDDEVQAEDNQVEDPCIHDENPLENSICDPKTTLSVYEKEREKRMAENSLELLKNEVVSKCSFKQR